MAHCAPLVSVFDQNAKLAAIDGLVNCEIPNEQILLQSLRERVGPHASEPRLLYHLRANRGRVHWASNSYLREAVASMTAGPADFEAKPIPHVLASTRLELEPASTVVPYRHCDELEASTSSCSVESPSSYTMSLVYLPPALLELILSNCNLSALCQASKVCRSFKQAAASDVVWLALYARRWGHLSTGSLPGSAHLEEHVSAVPVKLSWKVRYQKRHEEERDMRCPHCGNPRLVPVVYGFPSSPLVSAMRCQRVVLGGDYLVDTEPSWSCTSCEAKFLLYPYRCCT